MIEPRGLCAQHSLPDAMLKARGRTLHLGAAENLQILRPAYHDGDYWRDHRGYENRGLEDEERSETPI